MGDDVLLTCESYLLDEKVLSLEHYFLGKYKSKITRIDGVRLSKESPISLLEKACLRYGATMEGRIDAVKEKMEYMHRTPFIIIPFSVGAFPTISSESLFCAWIFNHPFVIEELEKGKSKVTLANGETIFVPVSKHSLLNQKKKLHSALDMFKKYETIQQSKIPIEHIYENQQRTIQEDESVIANGWGTQVAETSAPYNWKGKGKAK